MVGFDPAKGEDSDVGGGGREGECRDDGGVRLVVGAAVLRGDATASLSVSEREAARAVELLLVASG